ncbi:unnamed protein product, partial [Phaeothamnion confervicola]
MARPFERPQLQSGLIDYRRPRASGYDFFPSLSTRICDVSADVRARGLAATELARLLRQANESEKLRHLYAGECASGGARLLDGLLDVVGLTGRDEAQRSCSG